MALLFSGICQVVPFSVSKTIDAQTGQEEENNAHKQTASSHKNNSALKCERARRYSNSVGASGYKEVKDTLGLMIDDNTGASVLATSKWHCFPPAWDGY